MSDVPVIRFGIIGGGLMGREFASAAARWCHLLDPPARPVLAAVCDRSPVALEWFRASVPTCRLLTAEADELLASPDVDAVYCAVPHDLHESLYVAILRAGKHLLGEKPFGIDRPANAAIVEAARARPDLVVRSSSEFPFFPGVQRIVAMARAGAFGRILEADCGFLHSSDLDPDKPINWKRQVARNGAYGCMGDLGLHVLHVPLRLGWQVRDVRAVLSKVVAERPDGRGGMAPCETWDNATLLCRAEADGQPFPLTAKMQRIAPGETNTWYVRILGTRASARFSTKAPRTLETMLYAPGRPQAWCREDLGYASAYPTITGKIFEFGFGDAIQQMIAAFCDAVARPHADRPFDCATLDEVRRTHDLFTAALESQQRQAVVAV